MHPSPLSQPRSESAEASRRPGAPKLVGSAQSPTVATKTKHWGYDRLQYAVRAMDPTTTSTSNKYHYPTTTLKWPSHWKSGNILETSRHFAESHQHEHNEHVTWKYRKFTCLLERLKNDSEILKTSTLASIGPRTVWLLTKLTFQLQPCDSAISINSHLALSEKLFLQSPLWDLNCGGLGFFQGVNWKSSSKPCWLKSKLDSRRATNIEYIIIFQLCSSKFIPKKQRRKKELSRSGSIFRKNKARKKKNTANFKHPQPTASLHLRAHRLGNACQVLAHWKNLKKLTLHKTNTSQPREKETHNSQYSLTYTPRKLIY